VFTPLRLTVVGAAGTGKSFVIDTLTSLIRQMFQNNNAVHVLAPTGTAAFNIKGETLHTFAGLDWHDLYKELSDKSKEKMIEKLQATVAIFIDERSLISLELIGALEQNVAKTAHECSHANEDWGGIPVVVLFGDDYQLPPVRVKGAFSILDDKGEKKSRFNSKLETKGIEQYMSLGENVVELDFIVRQNSDQVHFKNILKRLRVGWTNENDRKKIEITLS